jgi:hypothetical protein
MDENQRPFCIYFIFALLLLVVAPLDKSSAALSLELPEAIRFFKSPESLFPSGQASREDLEKNSVSAQTQVDYTALWNKQTYHLKSPQILKEFQLITQAQTLRMTLSRREPRTSAKVVIPVTPAEKVKVIESRQFWTQIEFKKQIGWVPTSDLKPVSEDLGLAMSFVDSFLRKKPNYESEPLTTISKNTFFKNYQVTGQWLQVEYKNKLGFIDINHVYLRADFAKWAHHRKMGWIRTKNRENHFLRTEDQILLPLEEITGLIGGTHRALMLESTPDGPQIRSLVQLKSLEGQQWKSSHLKGHGLVWWKKSDTSLGAAPLATEAPKTLSTEQILDKDIFSYSFVDAKSFKGLISARGVYKSNDGLTWQKIETFAGNNEPVAIIPNKGWYVGAYRSLDEGKTFEPYIRWDKMTESIVTHYSRAPLFMKILKIEGHKNNRLQLTIDAGFRKINLQSSRDQSEWVVLK